MSKKIMTCLLIILIIAGFFRLSKLTSIPPGLYPDEAMNGNNALTALKTGEFKIFYPENNGREGLFINIQALFLKFFLNFYPHPEPWMLRIVSAIIGILTVLGLYLLAKQLFNEKIGLLSSFFLAVGFWHVNFSRVGFRAIMVPFCLVWFCYFLLRGLDKKSWKDIIASAIFFGLGFHTYIAFRIAPLLALIILVYYFLRSRQQHALKSFWQLVVLWLIVTFVIALPIGLYFLQHPEDFLGRSTQVSIFNTTNPIKEIIVSFAKELAMFNFAGDCNWRHNYACHPELDIITGIFFIVGIIIAIGNIIRSHCKDLSSFLLVGWLIIMILPAAFTFESIPHALRSIGVIPATYMLAAVGLNQSAIEIKKRFSVSQKQIRVVILLICLLVLALNYINYFQKWAQNSNTAGAFNENYRQIAEYLNSLPSSKLKFVIVNAGGVLVNNIPMPAQTVMFLTDTYLPTDQQAKNLFYLLPDQISQLQNSSSFVLIPLEKNQETKEKIFQLIPNISFVDYPYFWLFQSQ